MGYPLALAGELVPVAGLLAGAAIVATLVAVVLRSKPAVPVAVLLVAGEYILLEVSGHVPSVSVPGYAAGLLILCEILLWHAQVPSAGRMDVAVLLGWLRGVIVAALGGAVVGGLVLLAAGLQIGGALVGVMAGAAAALLLLVLPRLLLGRAPRG